MTKQKKTKKPTSKDVASLAGVSQSTVSRVFSDDAFNLVKPDIRKKVYEAATMLGYAPNMIARGMISGKTNIIGVVIGESIGPFYSSVVFRIIEKVQANGKKCLVFRMSKREKIQDILSEVMQFQVEGIIITAPAIAKQIDKSILNFNVPIILFNKYIENLNTNSVYTDAFVGGELAANYFIDNGHTNIALIKYFVDVREESLKLQGFCTVLEKSGITDINISSCDFTYESAYEHTINLIGQLKLPCAIFCTSDLIAYGVMDAVRNHYKLKIPDDVSVLGYDDVEMSSWKSYDLDSVHQPVDELVNKIVDTLLNSSDLNVVEIDLEITKRSSMKKLN